MATQTLNNSIEVDIFDGWTPDGNLYNDVPINLFRDGVNEQVFGFLDSSIIDYAVPNGDSLTADTLVMRFWDDNLGETARGRWEYRPGRAEARHHQCFVFCTPVPPASRRFAASVPKVAQAVTGKSPVRMDSAGLEGHWRHRPNQHSPINK